MRKTWTYHKVLIKTLLTYHVLSKVEVAAETARHQPIVIDQPVPTHAKPRPPQGGRLLAAKWRRGHATLPL